MLAARVSGLAIAASTSIALPTAAAPELDAWTPVFAGIDRASGRDDAVPVLVEALRVHLAAEGVEFTSTPSNGPEPLETAGQTTGDFLRSSGAQAAINANFFSPCCSAAPEPKELLGVAMAEGEVVSAPSTDGSFAASLLISRENQARIDRIDDQTPLDSIWTAVAGNEIVLQAGTVLGGDGSREPRTAVGLSEDDRFFYAVAIDGRRPGVTEGATMREVGEWLVALGAFDGLNLDGGGSTTLVIEGSDGEPQVENRPSTLGIQRQNGNALGVFASALEPADGGGDDAGLPEAGMDSGDRADASASDASVPGEGGSEPDSVTRSNGGCSVGSGTARGVGWSWVVMLGCLSSRIRRRYSAR